MNDEKNKNILIIALIVIIILLLILLSLIGGLLLKEDDSLTPNGNVDIFEINCDDNCNCTTSDLTQENSEEVFSDTEGITVSDNNITWSSLNNLRIFENPIYNYDQKIAPESSNTYQFVIKNNTSYSVLYNLEFSEENEYNINMLYRLRNAGEYIVGGEDEWVSFSELMQTDIYLEYGDSDTYYLDWKWFSSDSDTSAGENRDSVYTLYINIEAKAV